MKMPIRKYSPEKASFQRPCQTPVPSRAPVSKELRSLPLWEKSLGKCEKVLLLHLPRCSSCEFLGKIDTFLQPFNWSTFTPVSHLLPSTQNFFTSPACDPHLLRGLRQFSSGDVLESSQSQPPVAAWTRTSILPPPARAVEAQFTLPASPIPCSAPLYYGCRRPKTASSPRSHLPFSPSAPQL